MARYTGPLFKKSRRYRYSALETNKEFVKGKKRTTAPGQHGANRQKLSGYGEHLYEKQKISYMYGVKERQLKNTFEKSKKIKGVLGHNFLFVLESRLDNLVYRMGFANTRRQARQFVTHGHFNVNGKKLDIASYICSVGDVISLREKSKSNKFIIENLKLMDGKLKGFVDTNISDFSSKYVRLPNRDEIAIEIKEGLVVEFYNK